MKDLPGGTTSPHPDVQSSKSAPAASKLNAFLRGVRILDLSQYIPGPMASLFLADMGAHVLKIEPPQGDEMRQLGPRGPHGAPLFYEALNAGKSVLRMDLKVPQMRESFLELVRTADVVVEGFRPGVLARLGISYDVLKSANSRIILCSLNGYGAASPQSLRAAHDGNFLATSGILDRNGQTSPIFFDPPLSDTSGALFAVIAILGALHHRNAAGEGCAIDVGLADVLMPLQMLQVAHWGADGHVPKPQTTYLNGGAAYYQVYATADGRHVMLGAVEPKFWRNFCEAAGCADWIARQSEPLPQHQLKADVAAFLSQLTLEDCLARFASADCCFSAVLDLGEALTSEQTRQRDLVRRGTDGLQLQALFPALIDGVRPAARPPLSNLAEAPTRPPAAPLLSSASPNR